MDIRREMRMPDPDAAPSGEVADGTTVTLSDQDIRDFARLFRLVTKGTPWQDDGPSEGEPAARGELVARAKAVLRARRSRARHFNRSIFGEPAWEILLLLFVADAREGRLPVGQLAQSVATPLTTVLRWVGYLEKERLLARKTHPTDKRIAFIELTDQGRESIEAYLSEVPISAGN